jgi:hypothetical protein
MSKPSSATVIATVALFVALGGAGMAATGGNFILGQSNSADSTSALASGVATGPTLELSNSGGKPAARFNTPSGVQPFVVNNPSKVQNLNADLLDGIDSTSFTRGGGQLYSAHLERVPVGADDSLLTIPGVMTLKYECPNPSIPQVTIVPSKLDMVYEENGDPPQFAGPDTLSIVRGGLGVVSVHMLASRAKSKTGDQPVVVDVEIAGGWDSASSRCAFQAVAETFA